MLPAVPGITDKLGGWKLWELPALRDLGVMKLKLAPLGIYHDMDGDPPQDLP